MPPLWEHITVLLILIFLVFLLIPFLTILLLYLIVRPIAIPRSRLYVSEGFLRMGGERQRQRQRQRQLSPSEDVMSSFVSHADLKGVRSPNIVDGGLGRVWERERERGLGCAWGVGDEEGIMEWRDGIRDGDVGDRGREGKMKMNIVDTDVVSVDPMPLPTISGFRHQHHDHDYHHPDQAISTTEPPHPHLHAFPVPLKRDDHDKSKEQNPRQSSGMKRLKTLTSMESRIGVRAVSWWKVDGSRKGDVEDEEWVYDWE